MDGLSAGEPVVIRSPFRLVGTGIRQVGSVGRRCADTRLQTPERE
jgi:hypothetical protein